MLAVLVTRTRDTGVSVPVLYSPITGEYVVPTDRSAKPVRFDSAFMCDVDSDVLAVMDTYFNDFVMGGDVRYMAKPAVIRVEGESMEDIVEEIWQSEDWQNTANRINAHFFGVVA